MVNPESIDLNSLPWLPLEEKAAFPKRSSIYFAIDGLGDVQYIGRAVNVKQRWAQHHKYDDLVGIGGVRIAYLFVDSPELLPEIETALIQWFRPPLNFANNPDKKVTRSQKPHVTVADLQGFSIEEWVEKLPHIKRTDSEARVIQTFLNPEEKSRFESKCEALGLKMSHVLRCLAVQFTGIQGEHE